MFAVAFFLVLGYAGTMATGALDFYGYGHYFIVLFCAPVGITSLSYLIILGGSPPKNY
jgi:ABC-type branched-subunit amino acid transport system permease subunit